METFDQIIFAVRGAKEFEMVQNVLSATINEQLQVRKTKKEFNDDMDTENYSIINDSGISAGFGEIEVVDVKIEDGKILI